MYKRFKWNPEIRYEDPFDEFYALRNKKPSRVFIGSAMELFGEWINPDWMQRILSFCHAYSQHTFIFLTKQPQNLIKWSPFPGNCWVGVTATNQESYYDGVSNIAKVQAKVKFVSFEPLLEQINGGECAEEYRLDSIDEFDWLIIGQQTPVSAKTEPKIEWVREIVDAAGKARIPVFLKDNLNPIFAKKDCAGFNQYKDQLFTITDNFPTRYHLRQELPGD